MRESLSRGPPVALTLIKPVVSFFLLLLKLDVHHTAAALDGDNYAPNIGFMKEYPPEVANSAAGTPNFYSPAVRPALGVISAVTVFFHQPQTGDERRQS